MKPKISLITLGVADIGRSLKFYRDGLGFRTHNVKSKKEADEVFRLAISAGAKPIKDPQKVFWGGYSGYFADPDNYLWEVAYNPFADLS